jgi:hypothetical protein
MVPSIRSKAQSIQFSDSDDSADDAIESYFTQPRSPVQPPVESDSGSDLEESVIVDPVPGSAPRFTFPHRSDSDDDRTDAGRAGRDDPRFAETFGHLLKTFRKTKKIDWEHLEIDAVPNPPFADARDIIRANRASALLERLRKEKVNRGG